MNSLTTNVDDLRVVVKASVQSAVLFERTDNKAQCDTKSLKSSNHVLIPWNLILPEIMSKSKSSTQSSLSKIWFEFSVFLMLY